MMALTETEKEYYVLRMIEAGEIVRNFHTIPPNGYVEKDYWADRRIFFDKIALPLSKLRGGKI